jgi:hypothetical protein
MPRVIPRWRPLPEPPAAEPSRRRPGAAARGVAGKLADVVVFKGDPSRSIALMEAQPALILMGGQKVDTARLGG